MTNQDIARIILGGAVGGAIGGLLYVLYREWPVTNLPNSEVPYLILILVITSGFSAVLGAVIGVIIMGIERKTNKHLNVVIRIIVGVTVVMVGATLLFLGFQRGEHTLRTFLVNTASVGVLGILPGILAVGKRESEQIRN